MLKLWCTLLCLVLAVLPWLSLGKLCTNGGVSHTLRSQLFLTDYSDAGRISSSTAKYGTHLPWNSTWELGGTRRRMMLQRDQSSSSSSSPFLEPVSLHELRVSPESQHGVAQQTNLEYLLMLNVDKLVYSFRTTAGLDAPGSPYGGWENPTSELRGHFVGHYLSATALAWASTHNYTIYKNMNEVVGALAECQSKLGTGYVSAFPSTLFDKFESLQPVWAPYYTIHKIMAGLLDQYIFAENNLALEVLLGMANYFADRVDAVIAEYTIERHWESLNEETGGMNDVMYRLYRITGDETHLRMAHLFDKPCFLGLLAVQADSISDFHSNTHIPVVVGAQMRYEVVGDRLFKELSEYFMEIVTTSHMYATGGTSSGEFWTDPNRLGSTLGTENQESCTTYNMLKVARNLFRWTKEMKYADYYERALLNGVLTIQRGQEPGVMIYMLPLAPGSSKAKSYHGWGTYNTSFWCCYGTAVESFSKLGDSIYFEDKTQQTSHLYVIQFVSSNISWSSAGILIQQKVQQMTSLDPSISVTFTFTEKSSYGKASTLFIRVPYWTSTHTARCTLNGAEIGTPSPGTFFNITRAWKSGDTLTFTSKATLWLEKIQDERRKYSSLYAIYYGPYLLSGLSDGNHYLGSVNISSPSNWISPVAGKLVSFVQGSRVLAANRNGTLEMVDTPHEGSAEAPLATFKATSTSGNPFETMSFSSLVHREISLELMRQPGKYVAHNGSDKTVMAVHRDSLQSSRSSWFKVVPGPSGDGRVCLEASSMPGCFLAAKGTYMSLRCGKQECSKAAEFSPEPGLASYHPMSFEAYGTNSSFLLFPLTSYKDEHYAVYFDINS